MQNPCLYSRNKNAAFICTARLDSDFHELFCCLYWWTPLWYLMSVNMWRLNQMFVLCHSTGSAYQKRPTWHNIRCPAPIKRVGLLTNLKFENKLSPMPLDIHFSARNDSYPHRNFVDGPTLSEAVTLPPKDRSPSPGLMTRPSTNR